MAATNTNCLVGALVACIILLVLSLNISRGGRMPSRNEFVNSMPTLTSWVQDESAHEELEALRARVRSLELRLNAKFTALRLTTAALSGDGFFVVGDEIRANSTT